MTNSENFVGRLSEERAEQMMDIISGDDAYWRKIKACLMEGSDCHTIGFIFLSAVDTALDEIKEEIRQARAFGDPDIIAQLEM
jgi:hypothetical protein